MTESLGTARDFAANAELYVDWFDRVVSDETSTLSMRRLHEILGLVQASAARLAGVAPGDEAEPDFKNNQDAFDVLRTKLPVDAYSVVFNPLEYDPTEVDPPIPVMATISNDLSDVYSEACANNPSLQASPKKN